MQPELTTPNDCPNFHNCMALHGLKPDEEGELIRARLEQGERVLETIKVNQRQAAGLMLISRGCPQTPESLGVIQALAAVESRLFQLRQQLFQYNDVYIAPTDCEIHHYKVRGKYEYNKLTAGTNVFDPSEKDSKTRVIHLSIDDDPRNFEARAGIDRRNKLLSLVTQLHQIEQVCANVLANL